MHNIYTCLLYTSEWTKLDMEDVDDGSGNITAPVVPGKVVTGVCIKGSNENKNENANDNGYLEFFDEDGWFEVEYTKKVGQGNDKQEVLVKDNCCLLYTSIMSQLSQRKLCRKCQNGTLNHYWCWCWRDLII